MKMTIAFIGIRGNDGVFLPHGTAFFIGQTVKKAEKVEVSYYVVTARHVIEGIVTRYGSSFITVSTNGENGKEYVDIPRENWCFHPSSEGEYVDVAIAPFPYETRLLVDPTIRNPNTIRCWLVDHLITIDVVSASGFGAGAEVAIVGLFVHHQGSSRNIPIVRVGNIAAMPDEPVLTRKGRIDAYLVEVRSIGGLSGSPVLGSTPRKSGIIGLVHGHFNHRISDIDSAIVDEGVPFTEERINAGIAIVVPSDRILETLRSMGVERLPIH